MASTPKQIHQVVMPEPILVVVVVVVLTTMLTTEVATEVREW